MTDANTNQVIACLKNQRNEAMDAIATLEGIIATKDIEIVALREELKVACASVMCPTRTVRATHKNSGRKKKE